MAELPIEDNIVSEMVLCHNGKWLVCTHRQGMITIVNTEDMTCNTSTPLGVMESIWGLVEIPMEFVSIFEKIAFYTSNGLYIGMITAEGEFQTCEDVFF